jgi:hypothetical protein
MDDRSLNNPSQTPGYCPPVIYYLSLTLPTGKADVEHLFYHLYLKIWTKVPLSQSTLCL